MAHYSVLLAEDSPVNQDVGRAMLETLGCRVDVASNGLEAVRMAESNRYDAIFMDCQMPVMDGFEAVGRLRETESGGGRRTPVIALTGYIIEGERARCLAAGMDDHLGKPFGLRELTEVLNRWAGSGAEKGVSNGEGGPGAVGAQPDVRICASGEAAQGCPERRLSSLDPAALANIRLIFGTEAHKMVPMLIRIYLSDSPPLLDELGKASESKDAKAMRNAAHALKSTSANLGAGALAEFCRQAEEMAGRGSMEGAEDIVFRIKAEYRMVQADLTKELEKGV